VIFPHLCVVLVQICTALYHSFYYTKLMQLYQKHHPCYFLSLAVDHSDMFVYLKYLNFVR